MRIRAMDANGDYVFGFNAAFMVDTPSAVAQAIGTRLRLLAGEWFLDDSVGFNLTLVEGYNTETTRDLEVQRVILNTPGVVEISSYSSVTDSLRNFIVTATVTTLYGTTTITETL